MSSLPYRDVSPLRGVMSPSPNRSKASKRSSRSTPAHESAVNMSKDIPLDSPHESESVILETPKTPETPETKKVISTAKITPACLKRRKVYESG